MSVLVWQLFDHPGGRVAVPAADEASALVILATNAWDKKAPNWPFTRTIAVPRPPWGAWDRLAKWETDTKGLAK